MLGATGLPLTGSLALGLAAGLAAALLSAVSYLVSRHHGNRAGGSSLGLLVLAHVVMGVVCLPVTWLLWPGISPPPPRWVPPLVGSTALYLGGQAVVFAALRWMPASLLAPLLGLKIVMLAGLVTLLSGPRLGPRQWLAVGLSVAAATLLRRPSAAPRIGTTTGTGTDTDAGRPSATMLVGMVLVACLLFAASDLCIVGLIDGLQGDGDTGLGRLEAGALAMAVTYVLCGGIAAVVLPWAPPRGRDDWAAAGQYAVTWLGAMVALYTCFGLVGAVLGNVLQSTRGVMAVVAGATLARLGWHDLEERVDRGTFLRRAVAAAAMTGAVACYLS